MWLPVASYLDMNVREPSCTPIRHSLVPERQLRLPIFRSGAHSTTGTGTMRSRTVFPKTLTEYQKSILCAMLFLSLGILGCVIAFPRILVPLQVFLSLQVLSCPNAAAGLAWSRRVYGAGEASTRRGPRTS